METNTGKLELAIGAFILSGIAAIMFMVLYMTGGVSLTDDTYTVVVEIQNIGDLKAGAPVKLGGVQIGTVRRIFIAQDSIRIIAGIERKYKLRSDTQAAIATSGLVGDSFLEVTRGKSDKFLPQIAAEDSAPHIEGISQAGMGEILSQVQQIGAQVQDLVKNLNIVVGNADFRNNIVESMSNVNVATREAGELLASLRGEMKKVAEAIENVVQITDAAGKTMIKVDYFVDKTIGNPQKVDEISQTIASISEITAALSKNREYIVSTLQNVSAVTENISRVSASIDPNRGILRLLTDEQAGQDILGTIQNLQRAANSLATVGLTDLIADKLAADRIFELWKEQNNIKDPAELARRWKEWMAYQKRLNNMIMGGRLPGASTGSTGTLPGCN